VSAPANLRTELEFAPIVSASGARALAELRPALERRLLELLDSVGAETSRVAAAALAVVEQVRALTLRGGKRLRAGFVLAGVEAVLPWQRLGPAVLDVCVAVELFQTYLLIHDDWMDGDSVRRGGGARWLAEHAEGPYTPLWIGKSLYSPNLVVRSAILSALILADQG